MVRIINIDTKTRTIRVSNGKDDLEWFTTDSGSHVPLKKGQSKAEAIKEHFGDKKDKVSGKAIAAAKKEMLARQAKERKALRDSSSRLGESYYKQRVNELIKQQEIEEQDFYEGHGIKAPKAKQPVGQDTKKSEKKTKTAKLNSITLDRKLVRGGLSDYEIDILEKMQDYYDISDETINAAIDSGEYSAREIFKRLRNYDDEFAEHLPDLEDGTVPESKEQFVWRDTESSKEKQPAKQDKGIEEDDTVWIKMGGAIIPLRDGVSADDIDPKMLATPEEIKRGRAKYEGIKDRQDAARAKAKSGRTHADVIDEENWEELSRKYLRDYGGGKKLNHVELNSLMDGDKLDIIEKRKVREAMRKIGGLEE